MQTVASQTIDPAYARFANSLPAASANAHAASGADQSKEQARKSAVEFEGVFLSLMLKEMFSGVQSEGDFTGGFGEEMFRDMLSEQYAQTIADTGGIGLADSIYREILASQEISRL
ncbi:MAG: rod-binding protein [Fimbriimonadaceae bacterium]|nr:rod-binding protein [Alphaproteobacteria bacterium]